MGNYTGPFELSIAQKLEVEQIKRSLANVPPEVAFDYVAQYIIQHKAQINYLRDIIENGGLPHVS